MSNLHVGTKAALIGVALAIASGCSGGGSRGLELGVSFDEVTSRVQITMNRELADGETLHARVRRGAVGTLDCQAALAELERVDQFRVASSAGPTFSGPTVDPAAFETPYDASWLERQPTPAMLASIAEGGHIIDVCLMDGAGVVRKAEFDVRQALDKAGKDGKFDGNDEERIASTTAYAERCVADLGEIPFFKKLGDGDYETYNCLDSTPIATTVTKADGTVERPDTQVSQCDNPQYIYSLCEPNAVTGSSNGPRVARRDNDKGTSWVLLCRKAKSEEGAYNDIAMIGHNPFTGKTCFFQNALYSRTDGLHVPHPGDKVASEASSQQSESLWEGIHGGLGSGIECASCHDADPFIHTPWIDGARAADGTAVVPKMGEHENFALGFNDAPYSLINLTGQGWTMPQQLTGPEVAACTRCHRMGDGRWTRDWLTRLNGTDSSWTGITSESHRKFGKVFWMPPDVDGLDATTFPTSDYGKAMAYIMGCGDGQTCAKAQLPTKPIVDEGELPSIDLTGAPLARAALAVLGADVSDPSCPGGQCASRRCAECHSVSKNGLERWNTYTQAAWRECKLKTDPETMSQADAVSAVNCMRVVPSDPTSVFEAQKLGVLTTGVQYGLFQRLFRKAYGDDWIIEYTRFKSRVSMPKGNHPRLSQREFAILTKWFGDGLPNLASELREPPPPATCEDSIDAPALAAHATEMGFEGWGALNREAGIRMFGCTSADPAQCFASATDRTGQWGNETGTVRELNAFNFRTSFWTRSSADGRFVGNGGGAMSGATITDLMTGRDIAVSASYDPGFFPDNSGFIFQGSMGGAGICRQSLLERDTSIDFSEPECITASGINLYQHVARGLGGSGDYFIINSQFTSDSGGSGQDPSASFNASSTMKFSPMVFNGSKYEQLPNVIVDSPYEGDSVLSPSMRLVASRLAGPEGKSLGYVVRKVTATRTGTAYRIGIDQKVATICAPGAKVSFSFDERFFVTHHYDQGGANLWLFDLKDGSKRQITQVPAGQKALFPHFRSDGWIYFLIKGGDREYLAASDAALRLKASNP
ncbi:MAG: hypothetical protein IT370_19310 [Deltaproteobacteria bacterium]|nr:hypothetical protein [Deltaproteobacteria bacterium]